MLGRPQSRDDKSLATIKKKQHAGARANLTDYETACASFDWDTARQDLAGLPDEGGLNIAFEAVDRHAHGLEGDKVALRFLGRQGDVRDITYRQLAELTDRFANMLRTLGLQKGERVFSLAGRIPELYIAALGTLKFGCVYCPLFSAFGPEPIRDRLTIGDGRLLLTTEPLYRRKIAGIRESLPGLRHVLIASNPDSLPEEPDVYDFGTMLDGSEPAFSIDPTDPQDMALLHFTSGTTGKPKGAVHVHEAVVAHHATAKMVLDLRPEDVFWCTADPGWVTGTTYGIIAPLTVGATVIVCEEEFDAELWYRIIESEKVSVWYTAPTAIRMLMKVGDDIAAGHDLSSLRFVASVGEPLNPEAVTWGRDVLGAPIHDTWWQTETGAIMIANMACLDIKPGSMGRSVPGIDAAIVVRNQDGKVTPVEEPGVEGDLALKRGWPSMFRRYLDEPERYEEAFSDGWYLTGDLARRDADGYFWFVGRSDDIIKTAGHMVGPSEVEQALLSHPAVAEVGVIGKPDPMAGEVVKAFVELKSGYEGTDALRRELIGHARKRLGAAVAPKELEFRSYLPKTRSGKIVRRLLKMQELGLPQGDTSTLHTDQ